MRNEDCDFERTLLYREMQIKTLVEVDLLFCKDTPKRKFLEEKTMFNGERRLLEAIKM